MEPLIDGLCTGVIAVRRAQPPSGRIAGDQDDVGSFFGQNFQNLTFAAPEAVRVNVAEVCNFQRTGHRSMDFVVRHLDPVGLD
jgi:hypothetical protein